VQGIIKTCLELLLQVIEMTPENSCNTSVNLHDGTVEFSGSSNKSAKVFGIL